MGLMGIDLGFSGRFFDGPTGLVFARARLYDPDLASFLSRDPLGFDNIRRGHPPSLYAYARNRPGLFVDPWGLSPEPSFWGDALTNAGLFFKGAGEAAWGFAYETLATTYDLEQVVFYSLTGDLDGFQATSAIGRAAQNGSGTGDILWSTAEGVVLIPWEWGQSLVSGDPQRIGRATFNFELALYAAGRGELNRPVFGAPGNPTIGQPRPGSSGPGRVPDASAPVGQRGAPLENAPYQPVRNAPTEVNGRTFTGHALDQMQNRGLTPSVVENTIQNGMPSPGNTPGTTRFFDPVNNTTAIVDSASGRVITTY
jgi:RHS repeat-associated protein